MATPPDNWEQLEAKFKHDIEALTATADMVTVEKEIAEVELDDVRRELQETKDKVTELTHQIEELKRDDHGSADRSVSGDSRTIVQQLQKVEEQNELLKQALVKLRDMSATDKKTIEDIQLERNEFEVECLDLKEKEQRYLEQIRIFEEQIDAAQSAQDMVERLTQQKTELEDKLREMVEDLECMEKLKDLNDQLLESSRETELDLTNEIAKLKSYCSVLDTKSRDLEEYLTDQARSMALLKEENQALNENLKRIRDRIAEQDSPEQQKHQMENIAYRLNFSESKMAEREAEVERYKRNLAALEEQMNNMSNITKEQSTKIDELKTYHEILVSENSDLKRALRKKLDEVSELEIRRDRAETKLHAKDEKIEALTKTVEAMKGVQVQHEEEMKRMLEDLELNERERRDLRDQLNKSTRSLEKTMHTNVSMVTAQDTSLASLGIHFQHVPSNQTSPIAHTQHFDTSSANSQAHNSQQATNLTTSPDGVCVTPTLVARKLFATSDADSGSVFKRVSQLSLELDRMSKKNHELEMLLASQQLDDRIPPYCGSAASISKVYDLNYVTKVQADLVKLKREMRAAIINQRICSKSRNVQSHARQEHFEMSKLALKCQALETEAVRNMFHSNSGSDRFDRMGFESTPVK